MRTSQTTPETITTIGIDLGKNTLHLIGFDQRGAIILLQKVSRGQLERRLANIPRRLGHLSGVEGRPAVPSRDGMPIAPLRCRFPAKINGPSAL